MKVSVVIPCHNEKSTIEKVVTVVRAGSLPDLEIIVADDASNDGTVEVLQQSIAPMVNKIIYHPVNRGKGTALRSGFSAATGEAVIVQDAALEYSPTEYLLMLGPIEAGKADIVFGSRFTGGRAAFMSFTSGTC